LKVHPPTFFSVTKYDDHVGWAASEQ
jgi:hypothetical protein